MDKNLVNNQIILMRKIVRNAKRLVKQKLLKQIKKLEFRLNKNIEKTTKIIENKISNKRKELIEINGVNVDEVSKLALIHPKNYFEDIIKSSQSSFESKALARIAINEYIERVVNKFKEENPNCDQWLPSQIELWQQKKLIKKERIFKKKGLTDDQKESKEKTETNTVVKQDLKSNKLNPKTTELQEISIKSKPKTLSKKDKKNKKIDEKKDSFKDQKNNKIEEKVSEETKPKSDPFFLSNDSNIDEESDDNSDDNQKNNIPEKRLRNERFDSKFERKNRFSKNIGKNRNSMQTQKKSHLKPKKFETKPLIRDNSNSKMKSGSGEKLHPSWAAKRSAKDKLKIDLNERPIAKKIKFSDQ